MAIDAIDDPTFVAVARSIKRPKNLGKKIPPRVSVRPTKILPIRAPFTEPIPPITITTKARISTGSPIPT
jgi:hypothetical protein